MQQEIKLTQIAEAEPQTLVIAIDINARKIAEEKLYQEKSKLSAILRKLPDL